MVQHRVRRCAEASCRLLLLPQPPAALPLLAVCPFVPEIASILRMSWRQQVAACWHSHFPQQGLELNLNARCCRRAHAVPDAVHRPHPRQPSVQVVRAWPSTGFSSVSCTPLHSVRIYSASCADGIAGWCVQADQRSEERGPLKDALDHCCGAPPLVRATISSNMLAGQAVWCWKQLSFGLHGDACVEITPQGNEPPRGPCFSPSSPGTRLVLAATTGATSACARYAP